MFLVLTFVNLPIYYIYYNNTENNRETKIFDQFKFFTLGNLGEPRPYCGHTQIYFEEMYNAGYNDFGSTDLSEYSQDSIDNMHFKCEDNFYISSIEYYGFLYHKDLSTNTISSGERECHKINSPYDHY